MALKGIKRNRSIPFHINQEFLDNPKAAGIYNVKYRMARTFYLDLAARLGITTPHDIAKDAKNKEVKSA